MVSTKPYLIRAIHEWCGDQGFTPYLAVQVDRQTQVPREFVRDGQIVLNVGLEATHLLHLGNDEITFQTRFNGQVYPVAVPVAAVRAIYARENGQGMAFDADASGEIDPAIHSGADDQSADSGNTSEAPRKGGHLTRIK